MKFAVLKSKNQEMQGGNRLSHKWPSFSTPSSLFFDLQPQGPWRPHWTEAANPLAAQASVFGSCSLLQPRTVREWLTQGMDGSHGCLCNQDTDGWSDFPSDSHLLLAVKRRGRITRQSPSPAWEFSLTLVLFYLNQMWDLGCAKLPVTFPFRFYSIVQESHFMLGQSPYSLTTQWTGFHLPWVPFTRRPPG